MFEFSVPDENVSGGEEDEEGDEHDVLMQSGPKDFSTQSPGNAFATLPSQMASLDLSHSSGGATFASSTSGGPRKKRKHVEEDEVAFSLHTEQDPQRLVSTAAIPNDLFATELPVSNFSNFKAGPVVQPKAEPLTPFTPPPQTPLQPSPPATPASTPTFANGVAKPESTAHSALNHVHTMQIQQKGESASSVRYTIN